jgi:hypothetical protein
MADTPAPPSPPSKPISRSSLPSAPTLPPDPMDQEVRKVVNEISKRPNEPAEYRFVGIGDQVIDAMLETAKAQVTKAENNYKAVERVAEDIKQRVKQVWEMLQEAEKELTDYGNYTLDMGEKISRKKSNSK